MNRKPWNGLVDDILSRSDPPIHSFRPRLFDCDLTLSVVLCCLYDINPSQGYNQISPRVHLAWNHFKTSPTRIHKSTYVVYMLVGFDQIDAQLAQRGLTLIPIHLGLLLRQEQVFNGWHFVHLFESSVFVENVVCCVLVVVVVGRWLDLVDRVEWWVQYVMMLLVFATSSRVTFECAKITFGWRCPWWMLNGLNGAVGCDRIVDWGLWIADRGRYANWCHECLMIIDMTWNKCAECCNTVLICLSSVLL